MANYRHKLWSGIPPPAAGTDERTGDLSARIPAVAERLPELRYALDEWAMNAGLSASNREALVLASYEAMANVVVHAYRGNPGTLDVHATRLADEGQVRITVTDHGQWREPPPDNELLRGRGLPIMHAIAAHVTVESSEDGTTVQMYWPYASGQDGEAGKSG